MKITFNLWEKFGMTRSFDGLCPLRGKLHTSNIYIQFPHSGAKYQMFNKLYLISPQAWPLKYLYKNMKNATKQ